MATRRERYLKVLRSEAAGGAILGLAALLGVIAANSGWAGAYDALLHLSIPVQFGAWREVHSADDWIKEGLMSVFFFTVGLEIKHEVVKGELSSPRKLAMPLTAAAGGMLVPALIYLAVNMAPGGHPQGWPVPVATDIAFALAALAVSGGAFPPALRTFLLALAVADDLGAVVLIAVLFTQGLDWAALAGAGATLALMALLGRWRSAPAVVFAGLAAVVWAFALRSGVSPSVAAVAAALCVPLTPPRDGADGLAHRMKKALDPYVGFVILPLFAFTAVGFSLAEVARVGPFAPTLWGVLLGLFIGKPLGVLGAAYLATRLKLAHRPSGASWPALFGVAMLCGVGFTMSLFLGSLAFPSGDLADQGAVRVGVIAGSLASMAAGGLLLRRLRAGRSPPLVPGPS